MNTCLTCKWWGTGNETEPERHRSCFCPKLESADSDGAEAIGLHDDAATFHTGPNFGCVHHERAIPQTDSEVFQELVEQVVKDQKLMEMFAPKMSESEKARYTAATIEFFPDTGSAKASPPPA